MFTNLRNNFLTLYRQKKFVVSAVSLCCVFTLLLLSYKSGPAKNGVAVTGAPFNSSKTCTNCHSGGSYGAAIRTQLLDSTNKVVKTYVPGAHYTFKIILSKTSTLTTLRYGFQTTAATSVGAKNINKWGTLPTNTHNTLLSGHNYVEQSTALTTSQIRIPWTGPVKGTGSIKFYTAGNIVNNTGGTSGDQPVNNVLAITEKVALLPVTLNNVNVSAQSTAALISWSAKDEYNMNSYVIEKSINNSDFKEIGTVMAKGDGDYSFTDPAFNGKAYYRIKMKDVLGEISYSDPLTLVKPDASNYKLSLYNHAGYAYIMFSNGGKAQKVQLTYTDIQGRALSSGVTFANEGDNIWEIPKGKVKGIAIINVITEDGIRTSLKFIAN